MRSTGLMRAGHSSACCKTCSHTPEGLLKERALPACVHSMNGQKHGLTDKRTASTHMPTEQAVMKERRHLEAEGKGKKHVTSFPEWKLKAEQWWEQGQVHQACLLPADLLHRTPASPPFWARPSEGWGPLQASRPPVPSDSFHLTTTTTFLFLPPLPHAFKGFLMIV